MHAYIDVLITHYQNLGKLSVKLLTLIILDITKTSSNNCLLFGGVHDQSRHTKHRAQKHEKI